MNNRYRKALKKYSYPAQQAIRRFACKGYERK
jgi:hypothetical protein